jgi:murein DD-endopeptidase MepM/ murein hydrolase activator NlpD
MFYLTAIQLSFAEDLLHIINKGDTLYSLSKKYNIPLSKILEINNISDPMKIREGYRLIIKKGADNNIYTVKKGDTLYSIARKNNIGIKELLEENKIIKKTVIKVGQKIYLPVTIVKTKTAKETVSSSEKNSIAVTAVNKTKTGNNFFWPVDGQIEKLKGKLHGSRISAKKGEPVYSVSSGRVVWEGPYRGFGRVVFIESTGGYVYVYGGNEKTIVTVGDMVEPGSGIGFIGLNMHENKPGIYFSVYKNGEPVDVEKAPRL